ncbi:MAG TPA: single-strand selective monofunctional uracil-DNA glycosylase [Verrucomicrobiales bacterium]|nr:single-strand selective monofunctional uracil-DNA glycosylase [Verrucomicrobiales bacterium]HIL71648.1 single-strand selective monofunctional uracil-DNA glycosylase [Verrucomicrobiota bacterium]
MPGKSIQKQMIEVGLELRDSVNSLSFSEPVTHVYNPLDYAWNSYKTYIRLYGSTAKKVLFLGMNPGPFGMVQTGIPFGEIRAVTEWMKIERGVEKPAREHFKRPIEGFNCKRSEVSGRRLWGLFEERFPDAGDFFKDHFVANFCPLAFLEGSGRNRTPDKLPSSEMAPVYQACNQHLQQIVDILKPDWVIGVGGFAEKRAQTLFDPEKIQIGRILHPSPASPAANRGWAEQAESQLVQLGVWR